MAHSNETTADAVAAAAGNGFREAVCIDTRRIYDSCGDKDCISNLQVTFTDVGQPIIDQATNIKAKRAEAIGVFFEVEPVPFNKGFFSVDMTFFFKVTLSAYSSPACSPETVEGLVTFNKKVILFGSDASVKTFSTDDANMSGGANLPSVSVQVVDPMLLACNVVDCPCNQAEQCMVPPCEIAQQFAGCFGGVVPLRTVCVSLGLFSIVQLERQVQLMIPIYDFCIPDKACTTTTDDPCELFRKLKFPTDEFFPPRLSEMADDE